MAIAREVLAIVIERIGAPTLYGGDAVGPVVRWRDEKRTVLLKCRAQSLQLSVRATAELEAWEASEFAIDERSDPASYYSKIPYLWQLYRGGDSPPLRFPAVATAPDWRWLEESIKALLRAWWEQLPAQIGEDGAEFSVVPWSRWGNALSTLSVRCSEAEGVMLSVYGGVSGATSEEVMEARGWQDHMVGWWQSDFYELGADGAAPAARMGVEELRLRGVRSPADLRVVDVRCEGGGLLVLPGLAIRDRCLSGM
ncbi:hypothetical protein [Streptomyces lydicus]